MTAGPHEPETKEEATKMRNTTLGLKALALMGSLLLAGQAMAGLYCETETRTGILSRRRPHVQQAKMWVEGDLGKVLFDQKDKDNPMANGNYLLTRDGGATVYLVNPKDRTYAPFSIAKALSVLGSLTESTGGMISITFSDGYGEILGEEPGEPILSYSTQKVSLRHGFTLTTNMKMFGRKTVNKMDTQTETWIAPDLKDAGLNLWLRKGPPETGDSELDTVLRTAMIPLDGFPLKSVSTTTTTDKKGKEKVDQTELIVTLLREETVPASVFELPADYEEISLMDPAGAMAAGNSGEDSDSESPLKGLKSLFGGK